MANAQLAVLGAEASTSIRDRLELNPKVSLEMANDYREKARAG